MEITLPISSLIVIAIGSVGISVSILVGVLLLSQKDKKLMYMPGKMVKFLINETHK